MDSQIPAYGQREFSSQPVNHSEKKAHAKQVMEPANSLPELKMVLPVRDVAKLDLLAERSTAINNTLQQVAEFGIANPIAALWILTAADGLQLPPDGDLPVAKALLPQVANLLKKQL